jgi:GTPase SAR1 family protein
MARPPSKALQKSIETHLLEARKKGVILDIYRTAEAIQLENPMENVALEDIMEQIIHRSGANFAIEFAPEWATRKVPLNASRQEFLIPVDEEAIVN